MTLSPAFYASVVITALATWSISTTVAVAKVFEPVRVIVKRRSKYLGEGISCQRCISHWIAFSLVDLYRPRVVWSNVAILDYFITAMVIVAISDLIARCMNYIKR